MSQIGDRNRRPRMICIRENDEFCPAPSRRTSRAAEFEARAAEFHTVAGLAIRWGISERQVHRYIASDELIVTRFGRSIRISAEEAARFEASHTGVK